MQVDGQRVPACNALTAAHERRQTCQRIAVLQGLFPGMEGVDGGCKIRRATMDLS